MTRILVCGSRQWPGAWEDIAIHFPEDGDVTIIHGACSRIVGGVQVSVDMIADIVARGLGFKVERYPADWSQGKSAGMKRNATMLRDGKPDSGLAFGAIWRPDRFAASHFGYSGWAQTGTGDMVRRMLAVRLPVRWIAAPDSKPIDLTEMPSPPRGD